MLRIPWQQLASGHPASEGSSSASQGMAHPEEPAPRSCGASGQSTAATLGGEVRFTRSTARAPPDRMQTRVSMSSLLGQMPRCLTRLSQRPNDLSLPIFAINMFFASLLVPPSKQTSPASYLKRSLGQNYACSGFPGDSVVKNLSANAGALRIRSELIVVIIFLFFCFRKLQLI